MGHVADLRGPRATKGRREDRQCRVLGAADWDVAGKPARTRDDELLPVVVVVVVVVMVMAG